MAIPITHYLTKQGTTLCGATISTVKKPVRPVITDNWQTVDCGNCQGLLFGKPNWMRDRRSARRLFPGDQRERDLLTSNDLRMPLP